MGTLTKRQEQVLKFCWTFWELHQMPPTRAEIAKFFKFKSANAAECHLRAIASKGAIKLVPGKSRGIRLVGPRPV